MRKIGIVFIFLLILTNFIFSAKKITFDQAFQNKGEKLFKKLPMVFGWLDNLNYYELKKGKLFKVNVRSGKSKIFIDPSEYKEMKKNGFNLFNSSDKTKDFNRFLFLKNNDIFLFLRKDSKIVQITKTKGIEENPKFSPDGNKIAYSLEGNLFVYDVVNKKNIQLTKDGNGVILNGYASWIYYEEILGRRSRYKAFWWSPDSDKIVFMRFDQTKVPVFTIVSSKGDYGDVEKQYYPKAGYPNPEVQLGIADISSNRVDWMNISNKDYYLAFPVWNFKSDKIYFQRMNRGQDHLKILVYDLKTKNISQFYDEKQKTWVKLFESKDFHLLKNGDVLIRSSKHGWSHIYYIYKSGRILKITSGDWSVTRINLVNERKKQIYFSAKKEDSTEIDFYRTDFYGRSVKRLTRYNGVHFVNVSPNGNYFIDRYSSLNTPTKVCIMNNKGKLTRDIGDSYSPVIKKYSIPKQELFRIETDDGYKLPIIWWLPPGFDSNKKYPVIIETYGGPESQTVYNSYDYRPLRNFFLAQQGIIVIRVDHRGSGHFGKKGAELMYRDLGKWEMFDYIQVVKYLYKLPFIDKEKIGIEGGSYGGYVTALALTYGSDYFKYGIASFSVIDWRLYDTVYTERYMDTPSENPEGYKRSSVLSYIDKYKGGLRIIHGTMDDNVHMQNTIQFINKVVDSNNPVELMLYPGGKHGFRGKKRLASIKSDINFWLKSFFGKEFKP